MSDDRVALCGVSSIDPEQGKYLLLVDYHTEGLRVWKQGRTLEDLVPHIMQAQGGSSMIAVRIVGVTLMEDD